MHHQPDELNEQIATILGRGVRSIEPLAGGMIGRVVKVTLDDGSAIVAKDAADSGANFTIEGTMVMHLRNSGVVPVPDVYYASPALLLLEYMPGEHLTSAAERELGTLIARLHDIVAPEFGFEGATLNGSFPLHNGWHDTWIPFFRDHRLIYSADAALANGKLTDAFRHRIDRLCERLDSLITEPTAPALLHGDLWTANVLAIGSTITALIDPSVVYGHPELEIAYAAGTGRMNNGFIDAYTHYHPLDDDFWSMRRYVYLVYPAIMHVFYFGARYEPWLDQCLTAAGV